MGMDRAFLKRLWNGEKVLCPKCNEEYLVPLHKRRKDNDDWQCKKCGAVYRTINILNDLLNEGKN